MKCLLITVAFVAWLYPSESVIKCYECAPGPSPCKTEMNCSSEFDSCIRVEMGEIMKAYNCWKYSYCEAQSIEDHYKVDNFKYKCCKSNLCNGSPLTIAGSMITFSIVSFLTTLLII